MVSKSIDGVLRLSLIGVATTNEALDSVGVAATGEVGVSGGGRVVSGEGVTTFGIEGLKEISIPLRNHSNKNAHPTRAMPAIRILLAPNRRGSCGNATNAATVVPIARTIMRDMASPVKYAIRLTIVSRRSPSNSRWACSRTDVLLHI